MLDDQLFFQRQPFLHNEQSALITETFSSPTARSSYRTKNAVTIDVMATHSLIPKVLDKVHSRQLPLTYR